MTRLDDFGLRPNQRTFVSRFVDSCVADDRVLAAFLGGSNVKGTKDEFSDLDLTVITTDSSREDFYRQRKTFLESFGELLFLENFGNPNIAFYIFADGVEGELYFGSEGQLDHIHCGPFHVLLDKKNILAGATFPEREADRSRQREKLQQNITVFWHEFSHFSTAIGRNQLWWARGQLDALRAICINLARLQNNFGDGGVGEEPYFKIEGAMNVDVLAPLQSTFCPMEKDAMLQSVQVILQFYKAVGQSLAQTHGFDYPQKLESLMRARLRNTSSLSSAV